MAGSSGKTSARNTSTVSDPAQHNQRVAAEIFQGIMRLPLNFHGEVTIKIQDGVIVYSETLVKEKWR